eukprot:1076617-Rhodomonas_salina.1
MHGSWRWLLAVALRGDCWDVVTVGGDCWRGLRAGEQDVCADERGRLPPPRALPAGLPPFMLAPPPFMPTALLFMGAVLSHSGARLTSVCVWGGRSTSTRPPTPPSRRARCA